MAADASALRERVVALRNDGNAALKGGQQAAAEAKYTASIDVWRTENGGVLTGPVAAEVVKTFGNRAALRLMRKDYTGAREDAARALHVQPCYARGMLLYAQAETAMLGGDAATWPLVSACAMDRRFVAEAVKIRDQQAAKRGEDAATAAAPSAACAWEVRTEGEGRQDRALVAARDLVPGDVLISPSLPVAIAADDAAKTCRRCAADLANTDHRCTRCPLACYCSAACLDADAAAHGGTAECAAFAHLTTLLPAIKAAAGPLGVPLAKLVDLSYLPAAATGDACHPANEDTTVDVEDLETTAAYCLSTVMRLAHAAAGRGAGAAVATATAAGARVGEEGNTTAPAAAGAWEPRWETVAALEGRPEATDLGGPCARAATNLAAARLAAAALTGVGEAGACQVGTLLAAAPWLGGRAANAGESSHATTDEVARACETAMEILNTNAFEVGNALALVAPPLAWVNHSCHPNAAKGDDGALIATRRIPRGAEICTSYIADLMQPGTRRRKALQELHGFACGCVRCAGAGGGDTCVDVGDLPLADVVKCPRCADGWVGAPEGAARDCLSCGATVAWEEASKRAVALEAEVERVGPVLHGGMDSLDDVDQELLAELEHLAAAVRAAVHPCHWLAHRVHAYLIRPSLALGQTAAAAAHSLRAYAAMDATMQRRWPGKASRAGYIAEHYDALPDNIPTHLTALYTKHSLETVAERLTAMGLP